jgi:iron complex outermembrane receptor protein
MLSIFFSFSPVASFFNRVVRFHAELLTTFPHSPAAPLLFTCLLLFSVLSLFGPEVYAADPGTGGQDMEEIVVTATRHGGPVSGIPSNVNVVTESDIAKSTAQNVPDLLRTQAGILVNDINGNRKNYTVDIRGFGETAGLNTLVLVDGRRVNEPDLSGTDWTQIPLDRVEKIEIIRGGSGAVLYGDNASGGVINIITTEPGKFQAGIGGSFGSYDTYKGKASLQDTFGSLSLGLTGSYLTSNGYRDNSDTESKDAGLNLSYYVGDSVRLNLSSGYHRDETGLPGALFEDELEQSRTQTTHPDDFSRIKDYYISVGSEISFWRDSIFKVDASFRKRDSHFFASFTTFSGAGSFTGDTDIKTVAISPQVVVRTEWEKVKSNLTLGIDFEKTDEEINNTSTTSIPPEMNFDLSKKNYGYFIHDEITPLRDLSISAGYRHDKADFDFEPVTVPPDNVTIDEDAYTAGVNYTFSGKSYGYFNYSRSFRYPVLDEFFNFIGNTVEADLKAQRSDNYELGIRYYFVDNVYAHLNIFRLDTADELFFNPETFQNENLDGDTRRDGIELSLYAGIAQWLTVGGGYSYVDAKIRGGSFDGKDIPGVPNHKATMSVSLYPVKEFLVAFNGIYVGRRPFISDFQNEFSDQQDYVVLNAKFKYTWKMLTVFLDINNILDKKYSEFGVIGFNDATFENEEAFYPSPERNFLAGVSIDF